MANAGIRTTQVVRCPNCGSEGKRCYFTSAQTHHQKCPGGLVTQIECPTCDYLMVACAVNGSVVEAYTSGISAPMQFRRQLPSPSPQETPILSSS